MKKIFILLFLTTTLFFTTPINVNAQSTKQAFTFECQPYLQNLHQNGITISWIVNLNSTSYVEYGETEKLGNRVMHSQSGLVDVGAGIQKVVLDNLKPGTHYYYKAVSKAIRLDSTATKITVIDSLQSKIHSFTTPSASVQQFSFLVFNDVHSRPQFTQAVVKRENSISFVMLNGDLLDRINRESAINEEMLTPLSNYFAGDKPFFYVRGNHETHGIGSRSLAKYIDTPTGKFYYSFNYGDTHFVVLDCGDAKSDSTGRYAGLGDFDNYRSQEALWLAKEVQTPEFKNARFKVVLIHMPIFTMPKVFEINNHAEIDCNKKFMPILSKAGIDLLMFGHTHKFELVKPIKGVNDFPVIIGGGPFNEDKLGKTTYTLVEINKNKLTATLKKASGEVIGSVEVQSKKVK